MLDNQPELGETKDPSITFSIDPNKDVEKIIAFLCRPDPIRDGINFPEVIFSRLPGLQEAIIPEKPIEEAVKGYVTNYYRDHAKQVQSQLITISVDWRTVATPYFTAMNVIFGKSPWPYQNYRGLYTTTYPCPRYLETGEFQVYPSKHGRDKTTVAHELHHFRFFEYLRSNYCPEVDGLDERQIIGILRPRFSIPVWELSEALVKVHFREEPFNQFLPNTEDYPGLVGLTDQVKELWRQSGRNLTVFMKSIEK